MDLMQIAPAVVEVAAGDNTITVRGLSLRAVPALLLRFPELVPFMTQERAESDQVVALLGVAPDAANAIMAAGAGHLNEAEAETLCDALPLDCQVEMLTQIARLTFREGVRPFVDRVSQVISFLKPGETPEQTPADTSGSSPSAPTS